MASGVDALPDPPDAPSVRRSITLYRFQWLGLAVLVAIPVAALAGVFGERWAVVTAESTSLEVSIRYPTVFRYKMLNSIDVHVHNRGTSVLDTVTVALDTAYAGRFSTVTAVPSFTRSFEIDVIDVQPQETRFVRIEIQGEEYWSHSGDLTVAAHGDTVRVSLSTMIFP